MRERTESRRRSGEDGVDYEETEERRQQNKAKIAEQAKGNEPKQKPKLKSTKIADIGSVDSAICACGTHMRMGY